MSVVRSPLSDFVMGPGLLTSDRPQTGRDQNVKVGPPDLQQAVLPLSHGVQETMAVLFKLQENFSSDATETKWPRTAFESFIKNRSIFAGDWQSYVLLLQHCYTYARDYIFLCEYAVTRPASECIAFAKEMLEKGKAIQEELSHMRSKHEKTYRDLRSPMAPQALTTAPVEGLPTINDITGVEILRAQLIPNGEQPDNAKALSTIQHALKLIETSLGDMWVFWKYYVDELTSVASKPNLGLTVEDIADSIKRWKRYEATIIASTSSIVQSLDAVTVNNTSRSKDTAKSTQEAVKEERQLGEERCLAKNELEEERQRRADEERRLAEEHPLAEKKRLEEEQGRRRAEEERLAEKELEEERQRRADEERLLAEERWVAEKRLEEEQGRRKAEERRLAEKELAEARQRRADEERRLAEEEKRLEEEQGRRKAEEERRLAEKQRLEERRRAETLEREFKVEEASRKALCCVIM